MHQHSRLQTRHAQRKQKWPHRAAQTSSLRALLSSSWRAMLPAKHQSLLSFSTSWQTKGTLGLRPSNTHMFLCFQRVQATRITKELNPCLLRHFADCPAPPSWENSYFRLGGNNLQSNTKGEFLSRSPGRRHMTLECAELIPLPGHKGGMWQSMFQQAVHRPTECKCWKCHMIAPLSTQLEALQCCHR